MRGVVLAGGEGTRMGPSSRVVNKHVLPVYGEPVIFHPIRTLAASGVRQILVVLGGPHPGALVRLLGSGRALGAELSYTYQETAGGIADALRLARAHAAGGPVAVILGDNLFEESFGQAFERFQRAQGPRATVFLKDVADARDLGVAILQAGRVDRIVEKPDRYLSPYAVTGLYLYDAGVFDVIDTLTPSARGELEITDVNNRYAAAGTLAHEYVSGFWTDAGTPAGLLRAAEWVRARSADHEGKDPS